MRHTYVSVDCHIIFSTKNRQPSLTDEMRDRMFSYIGGVAMKYRMKLHAGGGMSEHIHLFISLSSIHSISDTVKLLKGSSSRWIHLTYPELSEFAWQEGYGAFGISRSMRDIVIEYLQNQVRHHIKMTYDQELEILHQKYRK